MFLAALSTLAKGGNNPNVNQQMNDKYKSRKTCTELVWQKWQKANKKIIESNSKTLNK